MSRIRAKDTGPERFVRSHLHARGYRFRLHRTDLPGSPDIVLPRFRIAIFVHGCFWHHHAGCRYATTPATRREFWEEKFLRNIARDASATAALRRSGWRVITVWECELRRADGVAAMRRVERGIRRAMTTRLPRRSS